VDGYRHLPQVVEWNRAVFDAVRDELRQAACPSCWAATTASAWAASAPWRATAARRAQSCACCGWTPCRLQHQRHAQRQRARHAGGLPVRLRARATQPRHPGGAPALRPQQIRQIGIRSVDGREALRARAGLEVFDMRFIDEVGMRQTMLQALDGLDDTPTCT
jgi:arginase